MTEYKAAEYVLAGFRAWMEENTSNVHTRDSYYRAVESFFRAHGYQSPEEVEPEEVIAAMRGASKTGARALRQGLLRLQRYDSRLALPEYGELLKLTQNKRNRGGKRRVIYRDQTTEAISEAKGGKLRLAFRLMAISGLRVSEVAALKADDITLTPEDRLRVTVRHGKGDKYGVVTCLPDAALERELPEYLAALPEGEKPFYSAQTLKKRAWELGIECHDLRRLAAQDFRKAEMERLKKADLLKNPGTAAIDRKTQEFLRHERFATTRGYLYNRPVREHTPQKEGENGEKETK